MAIISAVMLLLFGFITPATATTLTVTNVRLPSGTPFDLKITGGIFGSNVRSVTHPYAGQILLDTQEYGTVATWCVDDLHAIYLGGHYSYTTGILQTDNSGGTVSGSNPLSGQQIHDVMALVSYGNNLLYSTPAGPNHDLISGQIQAAIWGVIYAATVTAISGTDPVGALAFSQGVVGLRALAPSLSPGNAFALFNLDANGLILSQVLMGSFVPEPTTLALLGIGLAGAFLRRRRIA
ncbi:PEP-CTERM sorting domain-containing protein [Methylovulum sp.]|uniref:PEP-CTERM sorting domain-containing protein n=1 Tax=Methylovulum sp. TaxID=1916980 RepID=UPI00262663BC|nr:PEP-CTERM sorting domain-containing protein [Methylovulum sp.]MDD5123865.1 PEP-CTERM sorting domain-containing protein [Methylovulum sp.]